MSFEEWMLIAALTPAAVMLVIFISAIVLLFGSLDDEPTSEREARFRRKQEKLEHKQEELEQKITSLEVRLAEFKADG